MSVAGEGVEDVAVWFLLSFSMVLLSFGRGFANFWILFHGFFRTL